MSKLNLEMLTPERTFFKGEVDSLVVDSLNGEIGILAHHTPIVIALKPSMIRIMVDGEVKEASSSEGFLEVRPDKTVVLCQTMEWPEEIEENRVRRAIEEYERKLKEAKSIQDYKMSKATLARAFARLKVKKRH